MDCSTSLMTSKTNNCITNDTLKHRKSKIKLNKKQPTEMQQVKFKKTG